MESHVDGNRTSSVIPAEGAVGLNRNGTSVEAKRTTKLPSSNSIRWPCGWIELGTNLFGRALREQVFCRNAIDNSHTKDITYFLLDVPFLADTDLRAVPLLGRRAVLKQLMAGSATDRVKFSEAFDSSPDQ
jgi:bifunctional non-homologous end joining protein LigD